MWPAPGLRFDPGPAARFGGGGGHHRDTKLQSGCICAADQRNVVFWKNSRCRQSGAGSGSAPSSAAMPGAARLPAPGAERTLRLVLRKSRQVPLVPLCLGGKCFPAAASQHPLCGRGFPAPRTVRQAHRRRFDPSTSSGQASSPQARPSTARVRAIHRTSRETHGRARKVEGHSDCYARQAPFADQGLILAAPGAGQTLLALWT